MSEFLQLGEKEPFENMSKELFEWHFTLLSTLFSHFVTADISTVLTRTRVEH